MTGKNGKHNKHGKAQDNHIFPPEKSEGDGGEDLPIVDGIFPPTQQRMYDVLSDGFPHSVDELWECLNDELAPRKNISPHVTGLRSALRPMGYGVHCDESSRPPTYALVRFLRRSAE